MYFITTKRMLEVCFSAHPNIQYRTFFCAKLNRSLFPGFQNRTYTNPYAGLKNKKSTCIYKKSMLI